MRNSKPTSSNIRLAYVTNMRVPSEKAHFLQAVKMCEAFSELGAAVTLFVPRRGNSPEMVRGADFYHDFQIKTHFKIRYLNSWDLIGLGRWAPSLRYRLQELSFALSVLWVLSREGKNFDACICRDLYSTLVWGYSRPPVNLPFFHEAHFFPQRLLPIQIRALKKISGIFSLSKGLEASFIHAGIKREKIFYAPDGVDISMFSRSISPREARFQLGWPIKGKIIMYCGHLYPWKGVYTLVDAIRHLKQDCRVVLVGGTKEHKIRLSEYIQDKKLERVMLAGYVKPSEIPRHLSAADVLVLPHSARDIQTRSYSSPLKMFEYMAVGRPIVASDIPSISDVLTDGKDAVLVKPDDSCALAEGIGRVLEDNKLSGLLTENALAEVKNFSWSQRAEAMQRVILCSK